MSQYDKTLVVSGSNGGACRVLLQDREADKDAAYAHAHRRARWSRSRRPRTMVQKSEATRNMSDGDNATPGLSGAGPSHIGGDNQWLTRSARPSPGAAPWERNGSSNSGEAEQSAQTGNHTNGVTVADLIAKVHGASSVPEELRRPRPEPEPPAPATEIIPAVPADPEDPDTEVIPVVAGYASEVPELAALRRGDQVQPSRVGTG